MSQAVSHLYRFGEFTVDLDQKVLLREGVVMSVTPKVFDTLVVLVENAGRVVEKETLMSRVWPDTFVEEANLTFNITSLRKALGDNARHPLFVETVARRGYRFIAPLEQRTREGIDQAPNQRQDTVTSRRWLGVLAIALLVIGVGGGWWLRNHKSKTVQPAAGKLMLAVLPFENLTGDASQDYFSDGLTEEMITRLGNVDPQHLGLIARTSVMHYKNGHVPLDQIGRELGVQYVLEGSVRRDSDRVRVTAQLIQIKDQTHLWSREYEHEVNRLLSLQDQIAQEVVDEIQLTIGNSQKLAETARKETLTPPEYEAYDLYLKGEYFLDKRNGSSLEQAINYFQRATERDPSNARAFAALADSYALIAGYSGRPETEFIPKAREAALRAIALDDGLAEAHTALALIVQNYDWDWQTAEREFRRAIELNPNYATAHHWYAEHLTWRGRFDEALRESERARQLDPLSLIIAADNGAILYYSRHYDLAIGQFLAVREKDPSFARTGLIRSAYAEKGLLAISVKEIEDWRHAWGDQAWTYSELAYFYGLSGDQVQADHELQRLLQINKKEPIDPATIFMAYLGEGNKDQAFAYLDKAFAQHSNILMTLKVEPRFDPLRRDGRFQEMEHRVGL